MKTYNRLFSAVAALSLGIASVSAQIIVDNLKYSENGSTVTCTGLKDKVTTVVNLEIPSTIEYNGKTYTVTTIGSNAFSGGNSTNTQISGTLTLPATLISIGDNAFKNCPNLTGELKLPSGLTSLGGGAFQGCSGFTGSLEIPAGIGIIDSSAFRVCSGFNGTLTIPEGITSIGNNAFYMCGFTGPLSIPNSVTTILDMAFQGCSNFTGPLTLGTGITTISQNAFNGMKKLTGDIVIPASVKSLGGSAFYGCSSLNGNVTVNSATIGQNAFYGCSSIKTLVLSADVTTVNASAFLGCTSLTQITCEATTPPTTPLSPSSPDAKTVFTPSIWTSCPLYVPAGCADTYKNSGYEWEKFFISEEAGGGGDENPDELTLTIYYPEGNQISMPLTSGEGYEISFAPYNGWTVNTITRYDGDDTTGENIWADAVSGKYTYTQGVTSNQRIVLSLEESNGGPTTGCEDITFNENLKVYTVGRSLHVVNAAEGAVVSVFNTSGQLVASTVADTVLLPAQGVYIVNVEGRTFKVIAL